MTRSEIILLANQLTEGKSSLDNQGKALLLIHTLQKLCGLKRFWWRKRTIYFNTTASTATYDLTSVTTVPASIGTQVEEIISVGYVKSATDISEVVPVFDDATVLAIIEDTTTGEPTAYTIDPGSQQTVRLSPIPAGTYKIRFQFWAMPNPSATDDSDDTVPVLPAMYHHVLVSAMKLALLATMYGPTDPKIGNAKAEVDEGIEQMMARSSFTSNRKQQLITSGEAIRSTT